MSELTRNDSSSVISSLNLDYGDSDEEEGGSKDTSRNESSFTDTTAVPFSSQTTENDPDGDNKMDIDIVKIPESTNSGDGRDSLGPPPADAGTSAGADERREAQVSPVDFISDDEEGGEGHSRHHPHHKKPAVKLEEERRKALAEAVSTDSPSSQGSGGAARKAMRLVSYGPDEDVEESESEEEQGDPEEHAGSPEEDQGDSAALSRSVQNLSGDDIKIPPEPPGRCPPELQNKIIDMYERMTKERLDLNRVIQNKKNFRNPSIYDKLVDFCHIDEKGTNFPPEIYDPHIWGKESFYDELDKLQRKDMERREKEKKERTKIEFMTGTKKSAPSSDSSGGPDEKKRKSKWDTQPAGMSAPLLKAPGVVNPGVVNLTATATGTKATVISAVGSLSKKSSSSSGK